MLRTFALNAPTPTRVTVFLFILASTSLLTIAHDASAQRAPKLEEQISSLEPTVFSEGLTRFSSSKRKTASAWKALTSRIARGLSPEQLNQTLEVIAESETAQCAPTLERLHQHRRPEVRKQALDALVLCAPKVSGPRLKQGLDDLDKDVRMSAALALGQIQYHEAVPTLFAALDLGLLEAVYGLAQNINANEADRFLTYLGKVPLEMMGQAISSLLTRTDLPVKTRLEAVSKLEVMATPQARNVLESFVELYESDRKHKATVTVAKAAISRLTTGN